MKETLYTVDVRLAVAVPDDQAADSFIVDAVNESLRELQRSFTPSSCILDYAIGARSVDPAKVDGYTEGDMS